MKKVLLAGTALVAVAFAAPAHAELKLDLGGYFSGYGVFTDNEEAAGAATSLREFDLRRDTEVHVSGETTLDNGLTVGFHTEQALGGATITDEAYAYGSGGWGRVNLGSEDGAAYLLQVAAPGADANVDGLRTYIQALNSRDPVFAGVAGAGVPGLPNTGVYDYDHVSDPTPTAVGTTSNGATNTDRISYLTPKFNGFQGGVSFAPEAGQNVVGNNVAPMALDSNLDDNFEDIWEVGVRWDGEFQGFGLSAGGGYSSSDREVSGTAPVLAGVASTYVVDVTSEGVDQWNAGLNVTWSGFSLGGAFLRTETENFNALDAGSTGDAIDTIATVDVEQDTMTVGLGWDNGPYHLGASWLRQETERDASGVFGTDDGVLRALNAEVDKFTVGGGYTFGPGMTFRGAVAWGEYDNSTPTTVDGVGGTVDTAAAKNFTGAAATSTDFQQVTIGTQIDF